MFRKNYLPHMKIVQDFDTKKWYARTKDGDVFRRLTNESCGILPYARATKFETLDDLIAALYEYAYKEHLKKIKAELTHNTIKVNT